MPRPGASPRPGRLLTHGIDRRDCVEATVRAVDLLAEGRDLFGRYILARENPWTEQQHREFGDCWRDVLGPAAVELVERYRIKIPQSLSKYDLSSTQTDLGFTPRYNFETFLSELANKDRRGVVTPESPRWSFERGVAPPEGIAWGDQECAGGTPLRRAGRQD